MRKTSKFNKILVILVLISLILFLSSCEPSPGEIPEKVHVGTRGLEMKFLQNNPPNQITASTGGEINLAIEMKNKGAAPLKGFLYLSGFDTNIVDLPNMYVFPDPNNCGDYYIEGRTKYNSAGGICVEEIPGILNLNPVVDTIEFPLMAAAVYEYITDTSIMICIDPNYQQLGRKACRMESVSVSGGQGAPVAITKVDVIPVGKGKVQFNIHLSNVGGGQIVDMTKPPFALKPKDYNNVYYAISVPGSTGITGYAIEGINIGYEGDRLVYGDNFLEINIGGNFVTSGQGKVRLHNNRAIVTHTIDFGNQAFAYKTPLRVTLFYGYMQDIQKKVKINKIPTDDDLLFPDFGFGEHDLYSVTIDGQRYFGYHEDPYGHDVWRYTDKDKNIDIQFTTT